VEDHENSCNQLKEMTHTTSLVVKKKEKKVNGTDSDVAAKRQIPHDSNDDGRKNITRKSKKKSTLEKLPSSDHAYGLTHFTHSCSLPLHALWTVQRELVS
jgi:hypothetical protein